MILSHDVFRKLSAWNLDFLVLGKSEFFECRNAAIMILLKSSSGGLYVDSGWFCKESGLPLFTVWRVYSVGFAIVFDDFAFFKNDMIQIRIRVRFFLPDPASLVQNGIKHS